MVYTKVSKISSLYNKLIVDGITDPEIKFKFQGVERKHDFNLESTSVIEDFNSISKTSPS